MTKAVQQLLDVFETLTESEKHEAAAEVLRRSVKLAPSQISDEALVAAADELFLELDDRESTDVRS